MLAFQDNPLSDAKSLSKYYYSIHHYHWLALQCIVPIRTWIEEAPDLLELEVQASTLKSGWAPRKDSLLDQIIKEALNEDAPDGSLWRFIYIQKKDLKPVIIFGVIYIHWKKKFKSQIKKPKSKDDGESESKSRLCPEEVKQWPMAAKELLPDILMETDLPSKMVDWIIWHRAKKRKKGEDNEEQELPQSKQPRIETRQLPDPTQTSTAAAGSHTQAQSNSHDGAQHPPAAVSQLTRDQPTLGMPKMFSMTKATFCRLFPECIEHKAFVVNRLGLQPDAPLRVDIGPGPSAGTQVLAILYGEQPTGLAQMSLGQFCKSILSNLEACDELNMVNCSGTGKVVVWIPGRASTLNFELQTARKLWTAARRG
ncbi:hypothetical protein B0O99DRAFT_690164 [Bisporella sp. PMI_857]|nr:hypothetical protein B0O99DRAFT_690164 [Bisporella sp. PMI_857]